MASPRRRRPGQHSANGTLPRPRRNRKQDTTPSNNPTLDVTVTLPVDVLQCPLCFAPFEGAVFQCENGHAACRGCCDRLEGTCLCGDPIGAIRCRALESVMVAMLVPCGFASAGCKEKVPYAVKRAHEAAYCQHAPCACPIPGCAYSGRRLHNHIRDAHRVGGDDAVGFFREATVTLFRNMAFRVLLHAPDERVFLLLNGGDVPSGRSLALISVGPSPAADRALEYTMVWSAAPPAGEPAGPGGFARSLSASGPVPCTRRWAGPDQLQTESVLFVPDAYWSSSGSVSVTVQVKKLIVAPPTVTDRP